MKDFLKIFIVLTLIIASFLFGKNYGETNFKNSEEYLNFLNSKNSANDTDKNISDLQTLDQEKSIESDIQKEELKPEITEKTKLTSPTEAQENKQQLYPFNREEYKTYEDLLIHADTKESALKALDKLKLKQLDSFLQNSKTAMATDFEDYLGSYRGNIIGETGKPFGSLVINLKKNISDDKEIISGEILVYRDGREIIGNRFDNTDKGLRVDGSSSLILDSQKNYYQIYKLKNTGQLAGYFYERLVNGHTKVIGVFALNRVDQF